MASNKEVILQPQGNGTDGIFDQFVVSLQSAVVEVLINPVVALSLASPKKF